MDAYVPENPSSLAEAAYGDLRWRILSGSLQSGRLLTENDVADLTGFGKAPVRSALAQLRHDRLVDIVPRRGFFVRPWSAEEARQLFESRALIEPALAREAATRRSPEDLGILGRILDEWRTSADSSDRRGLIILDLDFHVAIARASGNAVLAEIVGALKLRSHHQFQMAAHGPAFISHVAEDHGRIFAAIAAGDGNDAESAMRDHIGSVRGQAGTP